MHECILCKRDMRKSKYQFGAGCIEHVFEFLRIQEKPKRKEKEKVLYKNVMERTKQLGLNKQQQIWLTDRFLTCEYLDKLPYGDFEELKRNIKDDIQRMDRVQRFEELKTVKEMQLKQTYDLYKKERKFQENLNKLKETTTENETIKLIRTGFSYIFNLYKNKNQYEESAYKAMQYAFWQLVIEIGGKYANFDIAAQFLQHSLKEEPEDLVITEGKIVEDIKEDQNFINKIEQIIEKYGNAKDKFIVKEEDKESITFANSDLYFAIHHAKIRVEAVKTDNRWKLKIKLIDTYDYTEPKDFKKYYADTENVVKSIFSSTLYNLAAASMKMGVMKKFEIQIDIIEEK